jgi:membrane protease YdiL (CAAX protease family)
MRNRALVLFIPLAFLLSWYPTLLHLAGVEAASGINPLGVLVAALICSAMEGKGAVKRLVRSIVKAKAPLVCYIVALLLPVALLGAAATISVLIGGAPVPTRAQFSSWPGLVDKFIFMLLFVGLGEEPGWRGFAIPQLQKRLSPLAATMVLAPVWLLWHVPLFLSGEFTPARAVPFAVSLLGGALVLTWLYNRSGGSVLLPMLMHATVNAVGAGYVFTMFHEQDLTRFWWVYAVLWAGVGSGFAFRMRKTEIEAAASRPSEVALV